MQLVDEIFVLRDFDVSGFSIFGTLGTDSRRYTFDADVDPIDIGLRLDDVLDEGLQSERVRVDSVETRRSKLEEQFKNRMSELSTQWEDERNRLNSEIGKMTQNAVQWEAERSRLNAEVEKLVRVQAATQAEAENAIMAMKMASAAAKSSKSNPVANEAITGEISRVEQLVKSITALIDDGRLKPVVDRVVPLSATRGAYEALESEHPRGKIVIRVVEDDGGAVTG